MLVYCGIVFVSVKIYTVDCGTVFLCVVVSITVILRLLPLCSSVAISSTKVFVNPLSYIVHILYIILHVS